MEIIESKLRAWRDEPFWDRLQKLEKQHQRLQSEFDLARRGLDRAGGEQVTEVRDAWKHYCEVIAELDQTTAQIEVLRIGA